MSAMSAILIMIMAMLAMSAFAAFRAPQGAMWPMQWDFRGRVTWRAPALVALLMGPVLALVTLGVIVWIDNAAAPLALVYALAGFFVLFQAGYLWFALRDLKQK